MKKIILLLFVLISVNNFGQAPNWEWAKSAGGTDHDQPHSVATDAYGNVYIAGYFNSDSITFGANTLTNTAAGNGDIFLVKYDAIGNVLWAKSAGGVSDDEAWSVAIDALGGIYVVGYFQSPSITFGTTTLINAGFWDMYIAKFDATGSVLWAKSAGGTSGDIAFSVATDTSGNAYVTGYFNSNSINFGTTTLTNAGISNYPDIYIVKYDSNGNTLWAKSAGGTDIDIGRSITTDVSGNVYAVGYFASDSITFGTITLTNTTVSSFDVYLVKYDVNGSVLWAKSAGGTLGDQPYSVVTDASGNVCVAGNFSSPSITFGSNILINAGVSTDDIFLAKYDSIGNILWAKSAGGANYDEASSIATDVYGNVYMAGNFDSDSISFASNSIIRGVNYNSMYLVKYNSNGNPIWAKSAGGADERTLVALDSSGNVYVAGSFYSPNINFDTITLTNAGGGISIFDVYLLKLGVKQISVGNNEITNDENGITIYPNPFSSHTTISFSEEHTSTGTATHTIKIINVLGECIQQLTTSNQQLTLDMSGVAKGIYFVKIESFDKLRMTDVVNRKIVLQ